METLTATQTCPGHEKLDPRVRRTRKLLEDAFRSLLSERPYEEISVGDITDRATVNRATFYAHYEDKHHLGRAMLSGELEEALVARLKGPAPMTPESLTAITAEVFEFVNRLSHGCQKQATHMGTTVGMHLQQCIHRFIFTWLELEPKSMRWFPETSRETAATVLAWSIYGGAVRWNLLIRRPPAEVAAREVVGLLLRRPTVSGA